jgi:hypothetical protein
MQTDPTALIFMYFVVPIWLAAGFADWLCHRAADIEETTGAKESLIHLLMFTEVGIALLAAIFLEINAGIIALMIVAFLLHEATAHWDLRYASTAREITPIEQHVHNYLGAIPLFGLIAVISLHWGQFQALFGFGAEQPRFELAWKANPLPLAYVVTLLGLIVLFELLPYLEELVRGLRMNRGRLVPPAARAFSD